MSSTGVRQQKRSQALYLRLLDAAAELLEQRDADSISVNEIAAAANSSVGSLYYHFPNKDEIIETLVARLAERRRSELIAIFRDHKGATTLASEIARGALANFRANRGIMRSAVKRHLEGHASWEPFDELGNYIAAEFVRALENEGAVLGPDQVVRINLAFAWLYGHLTMGTLGLHVPVDFDSEAFETLTVRHFARAVGEATN